MGVGCGRELQEIADEASRILDADITIEDREFNLVAFGTQREDVDAVRQSSILRRQSTRDVRDWFEQFGIDQTRGRCEHRRIAQQGIRSRLCVPARWRGVTYGYIWAIKDTVARGRPVGGDRDPAGRARRRLPGAVQPAA